MKKAIPSLLLLKTFIILITICTFNLKMNQLFAQNNGSEKIQIIAHRGYWNCESGGGAKNSIAALKAAQKHKFWGSEFDVNMTKDGVLLVWHDNFITVNGEKLTIDQTESSRFKDVRLVNGEKIPTVPDYLKQAKRYPETKLVYEIKSHSTPELEKECVDRTIETLKQYKYFDPSKVIFISFSLYVCKYLVEKAPNFMVQYLGRNVEPSEIFSAGIMGMDTHYSVILSNPDWCKSAKSHGMTLNTWTVNDEKTMNEVIAAGVDQITTDYPETLRALLKDMEEVATK